MNSKIKDPSPPFCTQIPWRKSYLHSSVKTYWVDTSVNIHPLEWHKLFLNRNEQKQMIMTSFYTALDKLEFTFRAALKVTLSFSNPLLCCVWLKVWVCKHKRLGQSSRLPSHCLFVVSAELSQCLTIQRCRWRITNSQEPLTPACVDCFYGIRLYEMLETLWLVKT